MIPVICLSILALCLLGALLYTHMAHARERQQLLDRIQFPGVSETAAAIRSLPERPEPKPEPPPVYVPFTDDDLRLSQEFD